MNKAQVFTQIITGLEQELVVAIKAAEQAHLAATDDQSVAETQYDTLSIEAGFLAHGQSQRAEQLQQAIEHISTLAQQVQQSDEIKLGSLVKLRDEQDNVYFYFIAPSAGGMRCAISQQKITVITPSSPLGALLMEKEVDDDVMLTIGGQSKEFIIETIY